MRSHNEKRKRAVELYTIGMSMNSAGKQVGCTVQTVKRWLEESGIPIRYSRPTYSDEIQREAERLYVQEQLSTSAVAKKLGLKDFTVKEWLNASGIIRSMSEAACLSITKGKPRGRTAAHFSYTSQKTNETHLADSSYEYLRMEQLDRDSEVAYWSRCPLRIPYVDPSGKRRTYNPDFAVTLANGMTIIEEVKPQHQLLDPINVAKFGACKALCLEKGWEFRVLTESHVGYSRKFAPTVLSKEEQRQRQNHLRRKRWANETPEQRAERLKKNAAYMRRFNASKREGGIKRAGPTSILPC